MSELNDKNAHLYQLAAFVFKPVEEIINAPLNPEIKEQRVYESIESVLKQTFKLSRKVSAKNQEILDSWFTLINNKACCKKCKKEYPTYHAIIQHVKLVHLTLKPGGMMCKFCGDPCSKSSLKAHILKVHKELYSAAYPFACNICHKGYETKKKRTKHLKRGDCKKDLP